MLQLAYGVYPLVLFASSILMLLLQFYQFGWISFTLFKKFLPLDCLQQCCFYAEYRKALNVAYLTPFLFVYNPFIFLNEDIFCSAFLDACKDVDLSNLSVSKFLDTK